MHFHEAPLLSGGSLLGHLIEARKDPVAILHRVCAEAGDLLRFRSMPGRDIGLVTSPACAYDVLVAKARSFEKSPVLRAALEPLAGQGLFSSEGELWRRQRKLMAPLFQPQQLEQYAAEMRACAERAVAAWQDGATIDVAREMTRVTMGIAGRTLFDADTFGEADAIGDAITTALDWTNEEASSPLVILQTEIRTALLRMRDDLPGPLLALCDAWMEALLTPVHLPGERTQRLREALALLDERVARMIADRREAGLARPDLLTRLLRAHDDGERMSDKQVRDEILTLFIAGHETTASALSWSLYLLARHDDVRRRVRAEVDALGGRPAGFSDLSSLSLCLKVFKEALRLYPPIYVFGRQAIEDVTVGDYLIPQGAVLLLSPYVVHRRPDLWPDPERFDPERFSPEAEEARPRLAFLPFSSGPRTCIGNHFALMEGPIALATILQRADLELVSDAPIGIDPSATLRPKGGIPMRVRLR
jgi:cytochrome P450